MKIGIIDQGIDQTHPFFNSAGYQYPQGYPKGNTAFTTPKVIVARSFVPPGVTSPAVDAAVREPRRRRRARHPRGGHRSGRPRNHGAVLHDAAALRHRAGRVSRQLQGARGAVSACCGLDGNAPEIAKAIDQAVADGMDVINLSLGEPEIDPARDIVVKAIDGAAKAGVIPCIAAGNEGGNGGKGSVSSPADAPLAITTAASTTGRGMVADVIANFSSVGPTPYSLHAQARRDGAGRERALVPAEVELGGVQRHEHGLAARRGRGGAAAAGAPDVDGGADQVRAHADRRSRLHEPDAHGSGVDALRGRRTHQRRARDEPARLRRAVECVVRPHEAGDEQVDQDRAHRRRRRRRRVDRVARARRGTSVHRCPHPSRSRARSPSRRRSPPTPPRATARA